MRIRPGDIALFAVLLTAGAACAQSPENPLGNVAAQRPNQVEWRNVRNGDVLFPVNVNNTWGHINQSGWLVIYPVFDWADYSYENTVRVVRNGLTGFVRLNGNWWIEPTYPYADRFKDGFAIVGDGRRFGYIDKAGKLRTRIEFDGALRFNENYAAVRVGDRCGFINVRGALAIPLHFARVRSFHEGAAMVQLPGKDDQPGPIGYIDKSGKPLFLDRTGRLTDLGDFYEGYARARVGDRWGYIGKSFRVRIEPRYEAAGDFQNGVAAVRVDGKWGYVDKSGRMTIEPAYELADDFDDALAMVRLHGSWGYINRAGTRTIPPVYAHAQPYLRSYARVSDGDNFAYIGVSGRYLWRPEWAELGFLNRTAQENTRVRVETSKTRHPRDAYNRVAPPPLPREPAPVPYLPDYLYEDELPKPIDENVPAEDADVAKGEHDAPR